MLFVRLTYSRETKWEYHTSKLTAKCFYGAKTSELADIGRGDLEFYMSDLFEYHWKIYSPLSLLGIP
jgi:hypothetical protein